MGSSGSRTIWRLMTHTPDQPGGALSLERRKKKDEIARLAVSALRCRLMGAGWLCGLLCTCG